MTIPVHGALAERFDIQDELGRGGFAVVYHALDRKTGRAVALKVLLYDGGSGYERQTRARFQREVRILRQLENPHTVRLLDHGELDGHLFAAFELVSGQDLSALLKQRGSLSPEDAVSVLQQVLASLAEAHRLGLVHRDLKPENIRVTEDEDGTLSVKVLDFGIARPTNVATNITKTGELIGTPRYMSPEQLKGQPLSPASDIYSLGMVAFELLLGRDALPGNRFTDQFERLRTGHLFSAPQLEYLGPLLAVIQRMTARKPESRYASAPAVLHALEHRGESPPSPGTEDRPRLSAVWVVLAVVFLISVGVILWFNQPEPQRRFRGAGPGGSALTEPQPEEVPTRQPADAGTSPDLGPATTQYTDLAPSSVYPSRPGAEPSAGCKQPQNTFSPTTVVRRPVGADAITPLPLLILLHSDLNSPERTIEISGFGPVADREGFYLVAPHGGLPGAWRNEDTAIREAVKNAKRSLCVDKTRVFLVGSGDGGRKMHRFYADQSIRAVALHSYLENHGSDQQKPMPVMRVLPRDSVALPLDGTPTCHPIPGLGKKKMRKADLIEVWKVTNGCRGKPTRDESLGSCVTWTCRVPFRVCVTPGGSGFPGENRPSDFCGGERESAVLPVAEKIWDFLIASPPREP